MAEDIEEKIRKLARKLQAILEEHLGTDPKIACPFMLAAMRLKKRIMQYGYLVKWIAHVDAETRSVKVEILVFQPKQDMTQEEARKYDAWFLTVNSGAYQKK